MICEIYGICIGRFNILWLILGIIIGTRMGEDTRNGRDASERHGSALAPVGIPTGTKGGFTYRVIYPVSKSDPISLTLGAPVEKPVPKLVSNRC